MMYGDNRDDIRNKWLRKSYHLFVSFNTTTPILCVMGKSIANDVLNKLDKHPVSKIMFSKPLIFS